MQTATTPPPSAKDYLVGMIKLILNHNRWSNKFKVNMLKQEVNRYLSMKDYPDMKMAKASSLQLEWLGMAADYTAATGVVTVYGKTIRQYKCDQWLFVEQATDVMKQAIEQTRNDLTSN